MTPNTTCGSRRWLRPAILLAGLLASEVMADGAGTAIALRSFGGAEATQIARRSTSPASRRPTMPASSGEAFADMAAAARGRPLAPEIVTIDPVRAERTARFRALIEHHSRLHHVDADLVEAIVYTESGGDERAVSRAGARGLMQLMPDTARQLGVSDPLNPEQSIRSGVHYLRDLLDRYGATELALWAYNAGPGAVQRGRLPRETADYVPRVLAVRRALQERAATPTLPREAVRQ